MFQSGRTKSMMLFINNFNFIGFNVEQNAEDERNSEDSN